MASSIETLGATGKKKSRLRQGGDECPLLSRSLLFGLLTT
jgi:hypothetical protein